ncbi:hypothetical protein ACFWP3_26390 [Streptomyces sp. NPDC058525]|uniref:hypothetical protein n=1 Tax=Streptomyces sp. NPDC058525 TaxID=3346538 RepID=UPI0036611FBE
MAVRHSPDPGPLMAAPSCVRAPLPEVYGLAWEQRAGRACVVCGKRLTTGAVSRGWLFGRHGAHSLDVEVWCCPAPEAQ